VHLECSRGGKPGEEGSVSACLCTHRLGHLHSLAMMADGTCPSLWSCRWQLQFYELGIRVLLPEVSSLEVSMRPSGPGKGPSLSFWVLHP
jgi:hypothetical protein